MRRFSTFILGVTAFFSIAILGRAAETMNEPLTVDLMTDTEELSQNYAEATLSVQISGRTIRVIHGQGRTLQVYSITGAKVFATTIDSNDKTLSLNLSRGWYIVKIEDVTRKIALP